MKHNFEIDMQTTYRWRANFLADIIEEKIEKPKVLEGVDFNMSFYMIKQSKQAGCGTACCIAGHIAYLSGMRTDLPYGSLKWVQECGAWLGIMSKHQCIDMFVPYNFIRKTRKEAAKALRHYAETGRISWN